MSELINQSAGRTRSYWVESTRRVRYPSLKKDLSVDVAVVGAGIAGLSVAYALAKAGRSVAVLEDGLIASGETSRTSAHLTSFVDTGFSKLISLFGLATARVVAKSHAAAIDNIEKIAREEKIDCDFKRVDGYLYSSEDAEYSLKDEAKALTQLRELAFTWVEQAPFKNFDTGACLKMSNQAIFHPMNYVEGLAQACVKYGGQIFEGTRVVSVEDGKPCHLKAAAGAVVTAKDVVIASGSPFTNRLVLQLKESQYRTFVICVALPANEMEEALYWDTNDPYHYVRPVASPSAHSQYVLIGGEDHMTGQKSAPKEAFLRLREWTSKRFGDHEVIYEWSGQVIETIDGLAFIGKNPLQDHVYVHTGTSGNGLTYGAIAGIMLPALILGEKSPWEKIYRPSRKTIKAGCRFVKEACGMSKGFADWLKPQMVDVDKLEPHQGAVVRHGLTFQAVYKETNGTLTRMSAICPHLGGVVRFNSLEQTWDCPCHGSRFSAHGEVINGPASSGLKKIE
jgi:glycine/D-amino acid oxidase-like deaminating enzyme/nitrite reductase/ring-hydroxylating ferredoxin subunit